MSDPLEWYRRRLEGLRKSDGVRQEWVDDYERLYRVAVAASLHAEFESDSEEFGRRIAAILNERPGGDL